MGRDPIAYGITTARFAVGVSAVVGITAGSGVIDMIISGITGNPIYMAGSSFAVSGSLIALGAMFPTGTVPTSIGIPPAYFSSIGASEFSLTKKLGADTANAQGITAPSGNWNY